MTRKYCKRITISTQHWNVILATIKKQTCIEEDYNHASDIRDDLDEEYPDVW
jgi:hypothetical protein